MDFYINLKVNFRGNVKTFLLSGSETKTWESLEAMVKRSFGLCHLQLTYFDEDNEEVSLNSQLEYEEALKSAIRQGNRLQMNVYETRNNTSRVPGSAPSLALGPVKASCIAESKKGFRAPQHCPALAQVVSRKVQAAVPEESLVILNELKGTKVEDKTPPAWFTSYMEKFKEQVVREAVEKICREFSGQCCIHKPAGAEAQVSEVTSSTLPGAPSSAPACSSCRGQTSGGGYQCSVCTSCTLCEPCSFSHDPSHNLVRARTPLSIPEHGSPAPDYSRFYRRGDRSFRKAEKQRLKAEKRQLKAEVKEIRKQLRMERRGLQWSAADDGSSSPVLLQPRPTQAANSPNRPKRPCPVAIPAMTAVFLDENLPDGTRLRPGTKFIKYWKMKNSGRVGWSSETKLKFMWGNLAVNSRERWREVAVPALQPGQVGVVSVTLTAPAVEGSYTSHWRLAHRGEQFGPRVWCSIVVDPQAPASICVDGLLVSPCITPQEKSDVSPENEERATRNHLLMSDNQTCDQEFYIPSVDLLTAQDLLSFELLDINIVQELENVPNNTPADVTPCSSPLIHDSSRQEKTSVTLIQEEAELQGVSSILGVAQGLELAVVQSPELGVAQGPEVGGVLGENKVVPAPECYVSVSEKEAGKVVLTVGPAAGSVPAHTGQAEQDPAAEVQEKISQHLVQEREEGQKKAEKVKEVGEGKEARSRTSSASSEDYIIILPDCFDTSRPLGESMYSSALSQAGADLRCPDDEPAEAVQTGELPACAAANVSADAYSMLCASVTLGTIPLSPVIVDAPQPSLQSSTKMHRQTDAEGEVSDRTLPCQSGQEKDQSELSEIGSPSVPVDPESRDLRSQSIADGLVKGALSVAASAYKALFTGQTGANQLPEDAATRDAMMAVLIEMGFGDHTLNQRLLEKHNFNLLDVVSDLVQMTENEWFSTHH
ncbi:next to BRCA1 gene 1 protein [Chanos chanos]|uniref:Next to BRCA1 gene 1 protein n=1 Tax=Chanos chanos TaxID=29144 RepID=A0A6J2W3S5_CHACN|nr:next to BRCA1 gene 1 protein-like [Chanos chanos]